MNHRIVQRRRGFASLLLAVLLWCGLASAAGTAGATTLPTGFIEIEIARNINAPTAMAFAPDGRLFVCEQGGNLRVIKNSSLLATPFVSLTVDSQGERGLLGVAFDPNFAVNRYVYVYYTVPAPNLHNRVSRFTANGDVAVAGSETVLLDLDPLTGATNHNGGALNFGNDGKLYIAVGENATTANSQTLANLLGKILRINPDGSIPTDNPFYTQAMGKNRAIWAIGLRNPFTFAFRRSTGAMYINDVGQSTWEEINLGRAGANYGWPGSEGPTQVVGYDSPIFAYQHSGNAGETGCSIIGGDFYEPALNQFPSQYRGRYFFADLCNGWIRTYDPATGTVAPFASGTSFPVAVQIGADGILYYLSRGTGRVYAIRPKELQLKVIPFPRR